MKDHQNPDRPLQVWFQESIDGFTLFVVFYTQACRYGRCVGCGLYKSQSSKPINYLCLMNQIDHLFQNPSVFAQRRKFEKLILSNNGSVLDEKTFSSTALIYLIAQLERHLPNVKILSLETRPEYVDEFELEFLHRTVVESAIDKIEIAVGLEAFSDRIRNNMLGKGLSIATFEACAEKVADFGFWLKCYMMFQPFPGITTEEAIEDVRGAIRYLDELAGSLQLKINIHLNPTYVVANTKLHEAFLAGQFKPPYLKDVATAALAAENTKVSVFLGLYDEGLAVPGGSFVRDDDDELIDQLNEFNRTQNFDLLRGLK